MHRAEKSSSRICRNREVERAQELHRKKLDGVKSYLTSIASRPTVVKPTGASFRRFKPVPSSLRADSSCCGSAGTDCFSGDNSDDDLDAGDDEQLGEASTTSRSHTGGADFDFDDMTETPDREPTDHSFEKVDECRSVAPVGAAHAKHQQQHHQQQQQPAHRRLQLFHAKVPPPPAEGMASKRKTLNGSLRMRRLKEIQADNVGLFERIKKSATHYRNDDMKREREQNVSYLSSISEFPRLLPSPRRQVSSESSDGGGDLFDVSSRGFKASLSRPHEHLPSIRRPAAVHPIKAIPTSPRKLQLNLSPAFRSLRKGMPQQPALPPLTAASGSSSSIGLDHGVSSESTAASPASMSQFKLLHPSQGNTPTAALPMSGYDDANDDEADDDEADDADGDGHLSDSQVLSLPSRATSIGAPFIGDLSSPSKTQLDISPSCDDTKYQLLKIGRFVGGRYLVLTVFCGDGVKNPYGFDVFAFDRESACEFRLSITKEMTHELLDTISSSSQAAVTAAAAGTNLSMDAIAHSICDHVNFAELEAGTGEMLYLAPNVGGQKDAVLLINSAPSSIAFCIHQIVEIEQPDGEDSSVLDNDGDSSGGGSSRQKRKLHVFASTRSQKTSSSPYTYDGGSTGKRGGGGEHIICFQMRDVEWLSQVNAVGHHQSTTALPARVSPTTNLEVEIELEELYEIVRELWEGGDHKDKRRRRKSADHTETEIEELRFSLKDQVSAERVVVAAMRHLHIVNVPGGKANGELAQVLIVNQRVNALLQSVSKLKTLETSRSRHHLPRAASPVRGLHLTSTAARCLLESGAVWKSAYVLARVFIGTVNKGEDSGGDGSDNIPHYIHDVNSFVHFIVFNSLTAHHSVRELSPNQLDCVVEKLAALAPNDGGVDFRESITFAKLVLARLQIEVDLFGAEVLTFPSLDVKQPLNSRTEQQYGFSRSSSMRSPSCSSRRSLGRQLSQESNRCSIAESDARECAATVIQASVRGYLFRKQYYGDDFDDEGEDGGDGDDDGGNGTDDLNTDVDNQCEEGHDGRTEMQFHSDRSLLTESDTEVEAVHHTSPDPLAAPARTGLKIGGEFCLMRYPHIDSRDSDPAGDLSGDTTSTSTRRQVFVIGALGSGQYSSGDEKNIDDSATV